MTKKKTPLSCDWRTGAVLKGKNRLRKTKALFINTRANSDGRGLRLRNINKATEAGLIS